MSPRARIGLKGRNPQAYPPPGVLLWHSRSCIAAGRAAPRPAAKRRRQKPKLPRGLFDVGCFPPKTPRLIGLLPDNTTFLPGCRKPSLTPVSYRDTVDIRAGAAWSIRGLSSTLLNEALANGGQNFQGLAEGL
jgi:hypothetical protein